MPGSFASDNVLQGLTSGTSDKESTCNTGDTRDKGSSSGTGRSSEGGNVTHSSILAWEIPWAEEPGGYC